MKRSDIVAMLALAAIWGGSYLFMRMGAGEFGALPLAGLRAAIGAALLLPLLGRAGLAEMGRHWWPIVLVGVTNSALPFVLFSIAAQHIPAGSSALITAATPLFSALIGWIWLGNKLGPARVGGLALGFGGVMWLVWDSLHGGGAGTLWASLACLLATLLYGFAGNYSKHRLGAVKPLAVAAGSQLASALVLAAPAALSWPAQLPSQRAWLALAMLGLVCTAVAYVLFFGLVARVGAPRAQTVGFMIPAFGVLWGTLFLGESFTANMAGGCLLIVAGTALTTGMLQPVTLWRKTGARRQTGHAMPRPGPGAAAADRR